MIHADTHSSLCTHRYSLSCGLISFCPEPIKKAHGHTDRNTEHTTSFSDCTVCCLLSTIHRTNQLITASVHRNSILSKGHLSIQRFSFFPLLLFHCLFILVIWYMVKSFYLLTFYPLHYPAHVFSYNNFLFVFWFDPIQPIFGCFPAILTQPGLEPEGLGCEWQHRAEKVLSRCLGQRGSGHSRAELGYVALLALKG